MSEQDAHIPQTLVRGVSIIAIREYVNHHLDEAERKGLLSRLPAEDVRTIITADKNEWYPLGIIKRLRAEVAKKFNPDDPRQAAFDIGLFTSTYEQSSFLKSIVRRLPIRLILNRAASLWRKFYRPGDMTLVEAKEGKAVLELRGFPPEDPLLCPQFTAWFFNAGQNKGLKNFKVEETKCIHKGDDCCRWEATWNPYP